MKLIIDIPKEFETDYNGDKFNDFFSRVLCDIEKGKCLCGSYEIETAEMFLKAFDESKPMANIVDKLEEKHMDISGNTSLHYLYSEGYIDALDYVSDIVKQEINNELE